MLRILLKLSKLILTLESLGFRKEALLIKIAMLEKNLSSRSKEIAMQNARLSELEKLLAKSSVQGPNRVQKSPTVTEELMKLKEENRVLMDAVDVMQQQVDDYESELKMMKDRS
jgi:dynactin 1